MSFTVSELCSAKIKGVLKDENDNGIDSANISALTVTLYDDVTKAIINSRDHLNILNQNGGSVDSQGNFTFLMTPDDNAIVNDSLGTELHHALIEFTYTGGKQGKRLVDIGVVNMEKVPYMAPPPGTDTRTIPVQTFFVSPAFTDLALPFFTSIQAALNAAAPGDLVLVYPGTYFGNVTLKTGVKLLGLDRNKVVLSAATGPIVTATPGAGDSFTMENLTIDGSSGIACVSFPIGVGSTAWVLRNLKLRSAAVDGTTITLTGSVPTGSCLFEGCEFDHVTGAVSAFKFVNQAIFGFALDLTRCSFTLHAVSSVGVYFTSPSSARVTGCSFFGGTSTACIHVSASDYSSGIDLLVANCGFISGAGVALRWAATSSYGTEVHIVNCSFMGSGLQIQAASGSRVIMVENSSFCGGNAVDNTVGWPGTVRISHCTFSGSATVFGGGTLSVDGAVFNNLMLIFTGAGTYCFVNCSTRSGTAPPAGDIILAVVPVTIFFGNYTSNGTIGANVTQAAGSFNVHTNMTI